MAPNDSLKTGAATTTSGSGSHATMRELSSSEEDSKASSSRRRDPLAIRLPADRNSLAKARLLASDRNVRIDNLVACVAQDPVLTLELLRAANVKFFVQGHPPITSPETAVVRLGSSLVIELLNELNERQLILAPDVLQAFEQLRIFSRRTSLVARIIATAMIRDVAEDAQTVGLMSNIGHLLACVQLGSRYIQLASKLSRPALVYRLGHSHNFDPREVQLKYLRAFGFPEELLAALDRDSPSKLPDTMTLRFIVESAVELVDAFDHGKWDKYRPAVTLPPQSSLRLLQLGERQYETVFERCQTYLQKTKEEEQRKHDGSTHPESFNKSIEVVPEPIEERVATESELPVVNPPAESKLFLDEPASPPTKATPIVEYEEGKPHFSFGTVKFQENPVFIVSNDAQALADAPLYTERGYELLEAVSEICTSAKRTEELLQKVLEEIVAHGMFDRTALVVVSPNRRSADIRIAIGSGLACGDQISVSDPLSPLASCLTRIQSFNQEKLSELLAPLGVSSFAISPLKVESDSPVVLYADTGKEHGMPFEARRVFRSIVGLMNNTLTKLPGKLPKASTPK